MGLGSWNAGGGALDRVDVNKFETERMWHSSRDAVWNGINTERSIPAKRRVCSVPLDNTWMAVADDFLLPALALVVVVTVVVVAGLGCGWSNET